MEMQFQAAPLSNAAAAYPYKGSGNVGVLRRRTNRGVNTLKTMYDPQNRVHHLSPDYSIAVHPPEKSAILSQQTV